MRTETVTRELFQFDELSDDAKEVARQWWRDASFHDEWWDSVYDDFDTIAELIGVTIGDKQFSGFWSQGDGASFAGFYSYKKGSCKAIRDYAPKDITLHRIADDLAAIQRRNFYSLSANITLHKGSMQVSVERDSDNYQNATNDAESEVQNAMRSLAQWLYKQLEREYVYRNADEQVDDIIRANGYEFYESGKIA